MAKKAGWNLQTNLKPKPNAQGTLFSGGTEQIPAEKRYPRGYTPERMRDVRANVQMMQHKDWDDDGRIHPGGAFEDARRTIARSTVPSHQLEGLNVRVNALDKSTQMARDGIAGTYTRMWSGVRPEGKGLVDLSLNAANDATVIHEVGHHVSHETGTTHSAYDTVKRHGEEEGFADHFADQHFVPLGKKETNRRMLDDSRRGLDNYEPLQEQIQGGRADAFHNGYNQMRPFDTRVPHQTDREWDARQQTILKQTREPRLPGF